MCRAHRWRRERAARGNAQASGGDYSGHHSNCVPRPVRAAAGTSFHAGQVALPDSTILFRACPAKAASRGREEPWQ